jgi:hypothetical protein
MICIKSALITTLVSCAVVISAAATSIAQDPGSKFSGILSLSKDGIEKTNQLNGLTGDPFACPGDAHGVPIPHGRDMINLGGEVLAGFDRISVNAQYPGNPAETLGRISALASEGMQKMQALNQLTGDTQACSGGPHGIPIPHGRDMTSLGNQILARLNGIQELSRR